MWQKAIHTNVEERREHDRARATLDEDGHQRQRIRAQQALRQRRRKVPMPRRRPPLRALVQGLPANAINLFFLKIGYIIVMSFKCPVPNQESFEITTSPSLNCSKGIIFKIS